MSKSIKDCTVIIPARKGSKGLPYKNRKLVPIILESIVNKFNDVIITTDDNHIIEYAKKINKKNIKIRNRPHELSKDNTSMKDTISDVVKFYDIKNDLIILYPTYPERTIADIDNIYNVYVKKNFKSMLCAKKVKTHPYMCLKKEEGMLASQIFKHDLYRRQDYPDCFEISHFVVIINSQEIKNVNNQMYNDATGFYSIDDKIDVDYIEDLNNFVK